MLDFFKIYIETERETEGDRERQRETEGDRERHKGRQRDSSILNDNFMRK